ncbi:BACON domain-containing protein [uncultured Draconibacterium sp.]|uniref:BACON domain-containing protein n=1 Tax=uncultured Draconibacterium sp. TaxID=1573823 RepID=UPI0029C921D1|nr:BACON domain-containing carbohydrate-binding protein [uncultured Draconibacterium sp.]
MKTYVSILFFFLISINLFSQNTYVPDDNFEQALIDLGLDSTLNDSVATSAIDTLKSLYIYGRNIKDLTGIKDFSLLTFINCYNNQLSSLDLSNNVNLTSLYCPDNNLIDLDLSMLHSLKYLYCNGNELTGLNLQNGNNVNLYVSCKNNPDLTCIQVDDAEDIATLTTWDKDLQAAFSEDCSNYTQEMTYVPDDKFEQTLIQLGYDSGALNDSVPTHQIKFITSLNVFYRSIYNLTGIEDFKYLEEFKCNDCELSEVDLSQNLNLKILDCSNNNISDLILPSNNQLSELNCSNNKIVSLDLSLFSGIASLDCSSNELTELNVKNGNNSSMAMYANNNSNLLCIEVDNATASASYSDWRKDQYAIYSENCSSYRPEMTFIPDDNFEQFLINNGYDSGVKNDSVPTLAIEKIKVLRIDNRNISSLTGIEEFTALEELYCSINSLTEVNLTANSNLKILQTQDNQLSSLDLSQNLLLSVLNASKNQLTNLDLQNNLNLNSLNCSDNRLTSLNMQIGTNSISSLDARKNEHLFCIQVDDVVSADENPDWYKNAYAVYNEDCSTYKTQMTYVPDDNFEQALIDFGYDFESLDDSVPTIAIESLVSLNVNDKNINDLTGIEDFKMLEKLECWNNNLTSLDLQSNTNLKYLHCSDNQISELNLAANQKLENLYCFRNNLAELDLRANPNLLDIDCATNSLNSVDLRNGNNDIIEFLVIDENPYLYCIQVDDPESAYNNPDWFKDKYAAYTTDCSDYVVEMTYIPDDIFELTLIKQGFDPGSVNDSVPTEGVKRAKQLFVNRDYGLVYDLTGIEEFVSLDYLDVSYSRLSHLDLRNLTSLTYLNCFGNLLCSLDLRNGNNHNMTVNATFNKGLACISVDDPLASDNYPDWSKDDFAIYSSDCSNHKFDMTYVPDDNFEGWLNGWGYEDGAPDDSVITVVIEQITDMTMTSCNVKDLTGIEDFKSLTKFRCYSNLIDSIDLSSNTNLIYLNCSGNPLEYLNVGANTKLSELYFDNTQLTEIELGFNTELTRLSCSKNTLEKLDLSLNPKLNYLNCNTNNLSELNVKNGNTSGLLNLYTTENPDLNCIQVDDASASHSLWETNATYSEDCQYDCNFTLSTQSKNYASSHATDSVFVSTLPECSWTTQANCNWLTIVSASTQTGEGYLVYSVSDNTTTNQRSCELEVADKLITITQYGGECSYSLSATSTNFDSESHIDSVYLTTNESCEWTVNGGCEWLQVLSENTITGNAYIVYLIDQNTTTDQRSCEITIAGQIFTVIQNGITCDYTLSKLSKTYSSENTIDSVFLNTSETCEWTIQNDCNWINLISENTKTGSSYVIYSIDDNLTPDKRQCEITIAGKNFAVIQNGVDCNFSLSASSKNYTSEPIVDSVLISSTESCEWTFDLPCNWITIINDFTNVGTKYLMYSVAENTSTESRSCEMLIAGNTYSIYQEGQASENVDLTAMELNSLTDLFFATGGENWNSNNNWLDTIGSSPSDWEGVTIENGYVTALDLSGMNLEGDITGLFAGFDSLRWLNLYDNNLTGSFSGLTENKSGVLESIQTGDLSINYLNIGKNRFTFADMEPAVEMLQEIDEFIYSPQAKIGIEKDIAIFKNDSIIITPINYISSTNDLYAWYKDDVLMSLESNLELVIENATYQDSGSYYLSISNSFFPDLILTSHPFNLKVLTPVGLNDVQIRSEKVSVFPNPAHNRLFIETNNHLADLKIFNPSGSMILKKDKINSCWLDIVEFNPGVYIFKFHINDNTYQIMKIVIN